MRRHKGGGAFSAIIYALMNIGVAALSIFITVISGTWLFGLLITLLSKWRVFAVSPRHWWLNIKGNLVDFIVRISLVMFAYYTVVLSVSDGITLEHLALATFYAVWMLFIKPRTSTIMTEVQAVVATFLGTSALVSGGVLLGYYAQLSFDWISLIVVLGAFVIGYGSLRHILIQSEDFEIGPSVLLWGLIYAQLTWVLYHQVVLYYYGDLIISQMSVVLTLISFAFFRIYRSVVHAGGKWRAAEIALPVTFVLLMAVVIMVWFSAKRLM
jgi:hypothetical protein